jgi:uracil-DNA glycosylase
MVRIQAIHLTDSLRSHFARLTPQWREPLASVLAASSTEALVEFVDGRVAAGHVVLPAQPLAALQSCAPQDIRVVILGQDPYHRAGQAHGYAFSVPEGVRPPPSLRNIFLELARDCRCSPASSGNLLKWSRQGVLLLNTVLTVEEGLAGSHARRGWEPLTDAIIDTVASEPTAKVFLLWGAQAQAKRDRIQAASAPQFVLSANHPSPLSARRPPVPFLGCAHFSQANRYLLDNGLEPIDWCSSGAPSATR